MNCEVPSSEDAPDQGEDVVNYVGDEDAEDQSADYVVLLEAAKAVHAGDYEDLHDTKVELKAVKECVGEAGEVGILVHDGELLVLWLSF